MQSRFKEYIIEAKLDEDGDENEKKTVLNGERHSNKR